MKKKGEARLQIGDILEILTSKGFAYMQYTHKHPVYGYLVRILPGLYESPVSSYSEIVSYPERFFVFVPLLLGLRQGKTKIVHNEPVPFHAQRFPLMRVEGWIDKSGKVQDWWLWDGEREWRIENLTQEQKTLSIRGVWGFELLAERIASDWIPRNVI
ncbi:MAG TPA: hypothetical protein PLD25_13270 [Chloroflexota bacterium]|nr:hypothetical protein [Chloroflexota bacterium]HUM71673.1 hypothetical protein [Chloroflexota bacterium]